MENSNAQYQQKKLVILGLENAGKTTIVDILKKETTISLHRPPDMYPTKGVQRSSLFQGRIVVWDLGGQEIYRNEYLANPESYFKGISFCYYVVDVQDYYRLPFSTMYFMGVLNLINKYSPNAEIILLFHKMDPDFNPNTRNLKGKFLEKAEPFLQQSDTSFKIFDTTIFNIEGIKTAFGKEIFKFTLE